MHTAAVVKKIKRIGVISQTNDAMSAEGGEVYLFIIIIIFLSMV